MGWAAMWVFIYGATFGLWQRPLQLGLRCKVYITSFQLLQQSVCGVRSAHGGQLCGTAELLVVEGLL